MVYFWPLSNDSNHLERSLVMGMSRRSKIFVRIKMVLMVGFSLILLSDPTQWGLCTPISSFVRDKEVMAEAMVSPANEKPEKPPAPLQVTFLMCSS